jgi:hypothetical protein
MSTPELERMLLRLQSASPAPAPELTPLTIEEALAYRDAGNLPDREGRTLRLFLFARNQKEVRDLSLRRLRFEPDYHDAPTWRRQGSKPINVVPLRSDREGAEEHPWWEEPDLAALESEWMSTGRIDGLRIPAAYRGFVYKTILSLRAAGRPVRVDSVAGSLARWLAPEEVAEIRSALESANGSGEKRSG